MTATALFPPTGGLTARNAARWVRALLAEAEALRTLDGDLLPPEPEPAADARARQLRAEWGRYAEEAAAVHAQVRDVPGLDAEDLRQLYGYVCLGRSVSRRSIEVLRDRLRRAEAGDCIAPEEARRELALLHSR